MILKYHRNMNSKDKSFLEKFYVKESNNMISLENFGAPPSVKRDQISTHQSHLTKKFYILPKKTLLPPIITWGLKAKNGNKNSQQENKSVFLRNLYKLFCLCCTFLQEFTIHDHENLLQTEKFWSPTNILAFVLPLLVSV